MKYQITDAKGTTISTNLLGECFSCVKDASKHKRVQCPVFNEERKNGIKEGGDGVVFLCSEDQRDRKSNRLFLTKLDGYLSTVSHYKDIGNDIREYERKTADRIIHNLITQHAIGCQKLYGFVSQDELGKNIKRQHRVIREAVRSDINAASHLILELFKNYDAMRAEFVVFEYQKDQEKVTYENHSIHKVLMNVLHPLYPDFSEKDVHVDVDECQLRVPLHYETFRVSLYLLFENAIKYSAPNSVIRIFFEVRDGELLIVVDMFSVKIANHELGSLCEEGYSGEEASSKGLAGKGIGMFRIKRLLAVNSSDLCVINNLDPQKAQIIDGIKYEQNQFVFVLNKGGKRGRLKAQALEISNT